MQSEPFARGRDADVFATTGGRVLRRYGQPRGTIEEAAVMQWAGAHGIAVPRVDEVTATDMVMERIDGPTMLDDLGKRPWRVLAHARTLAAIHRAVSETPAPPWLGGGNLVHLDLHPGNIMLSRRGPVVIDWPNARSGSAALDAAHTWLLLRAGEVDGPLPLRLAALVLRRMFAWRFVRGLGGIPAEAIAEAARYRGEDRNLRPRELERIRRLAAR